MKSCSSCGLTEEQVRAALSKDPAFGGWVADHPNPGEFVTEVVAKHTFTSRRFGSIWLCVWCRPAIVDALAEPKLEALREAHRRDLDSLRVRIEQLIGFTGSDDPRERTTLPSPAPSGGVA